MSIAVMVIGALFGIEAIVRAELSLSERRQVFWLGVLLVLIGGALYSWGPE